ncbi:hypothetical protein PVT67_11940 [Gallaecimonas kandeliae]|uniref:hypothetical protein n=1 Tax=Gallaecimonas kandeliae TaxID=3029055 RepID=UPI002648A07E|nr:hypothetical protein [Gallaecimonas kandeliae]WKE64385.1 hypothetical protein PVT67_11940 [Gallaecimonas kandeliae]
MRQIAKILALGLTLISCLSYGYDREDFDALGYHFEFCNDCSSDYSFERAAISEAFKNEEVVLANINTGELRAYLVMWETEPGSQMKFADQMTVPAEARNFMSALMAYKAQGQNATVDSCKNSYANQPFAKTLQIPASLNGVDTSSVQAVLNHPTMGGSQVSKLLSLNFASGIWDNISNKFMPVLRKIPIFVVAKYADGSQSDWIMGDWAYPEHPFRDVDDTACDGNGNALNLKSPRNPDGVEGHIADNYSVSVSAPKWCFDTAIFFMNGSTTGGDCLTLVAP